MIEMQIISRMAGEIMRSASKITRLATERRSEVITISDAEYIAQRISEMHATIGAIESLMSSPDATGSQR